MSSELNEILMYPIKIRAKLDQNECPLKPPMVVIESIKKSLDVVNRYQTSMLFNYVLELYSDYSGVSKKNLFATPGIDIVFEKLLNYLRGKKILVPRPCYFLFREQAAHFGVKLKYIELQEPYFEIDLERLHSVSREVDMIFLDNPNNPTGQTIIKPKDIEELAGEFGGPIVIDEAYYEFSGESAIELVENHENIIVTRSLSKAFCLAGMRVAFIAYSSNLKKLFFDKVEMFRIPTPSLIAAKAALENNKYVKDVVAYTIKEKEKIYWGLKELGLIPYQSKTNFLLVNTKMEGLYEYLYRKGVLVKDLSDILDPVHIRVSVGLPKENDLFLEEVRNYIELRTGS